MSSNFYDRLVRCDILTSERYCTLLTDTHKLAYRDLIHLADDFGNLELNFFRILRTFQVCNSINTKETLVDVLDKLMAADLVRTFQDQGKNWIHIPRHDNTRRYKTRKTPMSPWCDPNVRSDLEKRMGWPAGAQTNPALRPDRDGVIQSNQQITSKSAADLQQIIGRPAADLPMISSESSTDLRLGVGVGVNQNLSHADPRPEPDQAKDQDSIETARPPKTTKGTRLPKGWTIPEPWVTWAAQYCAGLGFPASRGTLLRIADGFSDYWQGKPGQSGTKLDWEATWRNWVRNTDWRKQGNGGGGSSGPGFDRAI